MLSGLWILWEDLSYKANLFSTHLLDSRRWLGTSFGLLGSSTRFLKRRGDTFWNGSSAFFTSLLGVFTAAILSWKMGVFFLKPKVISWEENSSSIIIHRKPHTIDKCTSCHCVVYCGSGLPHLSSHSWPLCAHTGCPVHLASHISCRAML